MKNFVLPAGWRLKKTKQEGWILYTECGQDFSLDFASLKALSPRQTLARAIGFKGKPLSVLDVTAGWGKEAFLMARAGCLVTAVEKNPFVFHFVRESLAEKSIQPPSLHFALDNSLNYLKTLKKEDRPDVIYMDPLFGEEKKSLSVKSLRILKRLVQEKGDSRELFSLALKKALQRVVVKRHHREPPFKGHRLCSFTGRSTRYDVFMPKKGEAL